MTPLTPETEKLIGKREFEQMKKSAIFINASRGKTVDEEALIGALQNGEIHERVKAVLVQKSNCPFPILKLGRGVYLFVFI